MVQWGAVKDSQDQQGKSGDALHRQQQEGLDVQVLATFVRLKATQVFPEHHIAGVGTIWGVGKGSAMVQNNSALVKGHHTFRPCTHALCNQHPIRATFYHGN